MRSLALTASPPGHSVRVIHTSSMASSAPRKHRKPSTAPKMSSHQTVQDTVALLQAQLYTCCCRQIISIPLSQAQGLTVARLGNVQVITPELPFQHCERLPEGHLCVFEVALV